MQDQVRLDWKSPALGVVDRAGAALLARRGWWPAAGLLLLCWLAFAAPWLSGSRVIPWDAKDFYYPALRALASALAHGDSGMWNPWLRGGSAAVADPQSWLFTPSFRLLATLDSDPSMRLADVVTLLHLLFGGLGVLLLGRAFGQRPFAALLAAVVLMFAGAAAARLQHTIMIVSYSHLPWAILLLWLTFTSTGRRRRIAASCGFGLVAGLMALDRDQVAFLNAIFLLLAAAWLAIRAARRKGPLALLRHGLELVPAGLIGAALLAIPALLTLQTLPATTRADIGLATTVEGSLHPASFLTMLAPNLFGALAPDGYWGPGSDPWLDMFSRLGFSNDETTSYLYLGALPLALLVLVASSADLRRRFLSRDETGLYLLGLGFALIYGLGGFTPLFQLLYHHLPGVSLYRRPNDAEFLVTAMLALTVGSAADALAGIRHGGLAISRRAWIALGVTGLAALAVSLWLGQAFGHLLPAARELALSLALAVGAFVLLWRRPVLLGRGVWAAAIVLIAAADLTIRHSGSELNAALPANIVAYTPQGARLAADIKTILGEEGGHYRAEIYGLDAPGGDGGGSWQNAALVYGIEQTLGYDPLLPTDYADAVGADQNSNLPQRRLTDLFTGYASPLARLLGIRLVVTGDPIDTILPPEARRNLRLLKKEFGAFFYLNPDALPRAMLVPRAIVDRGGGLPEDPTRTVFIEGLGEDEPALTDTIEPLGSVDIETYKADTVDIRAKLQRAGWLVLNDAFHPAWHALVDDHEVPVRRANRLFRALKVSEGEHRIEFRFEPLRAGDLWDMAKRQFGGAALKTLTETCPPPAAGEGTVAQGGCRE